MSTPNPSPEASPVPKRKKGIVNKDLHKKEQIKISRQKGTEYVNTQGNVVAAKTTGPDCLCRQKCTETFSDIEKENLIKLLYNGRPKNEQDTYLMGLIESKEVARRRPTNDESKQQSSSFVYFAMKGVTRTKVCRKAFCSLFAVSNKVVFRLSSLVAANKTPVDMRGKHRNRGNLVPVDAVAKIDAHIQSFPKKISHYSARNVTYLESGLNVLKMHELLLLKYPELTGIVKYEYYLKYFRDNFGYRFGRPQVDVCGTCEDLNMKIKSPVLNENAKRVAAAELMVHKRRTKKFYNKLQEITQLCKEREDVMGIVFDYMQNLPLPFIPVQEMFYLRKLWLYVFCIHNVKNNSSKFYTYHEGIACKGPNEVCSFISDYIDKYIPPEVKELHIFSDACGGQNRNHTVTRFMMALTMTGRFKVIQQYFPVRGHSYLPCDRNFATVKRQVRRYDRLYSPEQYSSLIANAKKQEPLFEVREIKNRDIVNFKDWWPRYFKKTSKSIGSSGATFTISLYRHFIYRSEEKGYLTAFDFIDGFSKVSFRLMKGNEEVVLPTIKAYSGQVPITAKKLADVRSIVRYIPDEHKAFFNEILSWKTQDGEDRDEDD